MPIVGAIRRVHSKYAANVTANNRTSRVREIRNRNTTTTIGSTREGEGDLKTV